MKPAFTEENGRTVCTSDAGKRWRCSCSFWWDWSIESCSVCNAPRDKDEPPLTATAGAAVPVAA